VTDPPGPHWIDYVAAISTALAVFVALGVALWARLREDRLRPELRLIYEPGLGSDDFAAGLQTGAGEQHYVRMRVANRWGRRSADDVEVLVVSLREDRKAPGPLPMSGYAFIWSNTFDPEGRPVTRLTIPPGVARHFDLFAVREPLVSDGAGGAVPVGKDGAADASAELQIQPRPSDSRHHLGRGKHILTVALTARDTDAAYYAIYVDFDGLWWAAASIREHLKVAPPTHAGYMALEPEEGARRWDRAHFSWDNRLAFALRHVNPVRRLRVRRWRKARIHGGPTDPAKDTARERDEGDA